MDPSIQVKMKIKGELFPSYRRYVNEKNLFEILDYINSMEDSDKKDYGTIVVSYTDASFSGCRIKSDLVIENYYELLNMIESMT